MKNIAFDKGESISHAYILASPSLTERTEDAKELAAAMVCEASGRRPCRQCRQCRKALERIHPDIIYVSREKDDKGRAKREISVAQIRAVVADACVMPNEAERKVYVILEGDAMNVPAQNALLKLLEEPPKSVAFIIGTPSAELLLPTVRSRCVSLRAAGDEEGDGEAEARAAEFFAALTKGSRSELLRWCVSAESMDGRQAEAFVRAARGRLADALTGRAEAISAKRALEIDALLCRCGEYLRLNTGVKHVMGLLAADGITEDK